MTESTALVQSEAAAPLPVFTGAGMAIAFTAYRSLQAALDAALPDCVQMIGDKPFRKKNYWRAVGRAFNLTIRLVDERREVYGEFADGRENFGWLVTYEARSADGGSSPGDGAAFAVEKAEKFRCPHQVAGRRDGWVEHYKPETCPDFDPEYRWRLLPSQATEHNVRGHAHTRAYNRAVSNLVGFGEVSYEEAESHPEYGGGDREESSGPRPVGASASAPRGTRPAKPISEAQGRRLRAIASGSKWNEADVHALLAQDRYGFKHVAEITQDKYDAICEELGKPAIGTDR